MNSNKKKYRRNLAINLISEGYNEILSVDGTIEKVRIPVDIRHSSKNQSIFIHRFLKSLPQEYYLKEILNDALNEAYRKCIEDPDASRLDITISTKLDTDRIGYVNLIQLFSKQEKSNE